MPARSRSRAAAPASRWRSTIPAATAATSSTSSIAVSSWFAASALALAALLSLGRSAAAGDLYGVVVGIDRYRHIQPLDGAVNDARDVAAALQEAGARRVTLLLDEA